MKPYRIRLRKSRLRRFRSGATLVEFAAVVGIFFLFIFGIVEYCRLMFVREIMLHAAREGARYAVVHTTDATVVADTKTLVKTKMAGVDTMLESGTYQCQVYLANTAGTNIGNATDATFGEGIGVQVDGTFNPVLPSFIFLNSKLKLSFKSVMGSEAN